MQAGHSTSFSIAFDIYVDITGMRAVMKSSKFPCTIDAN